MKPNAPQARLIKQNAPQARSWHGGVVCPIDMLCNSFFTMNSSESSFFNEILINDIIH